MHQIPTPTPWLTRIRFTQIYLTQLFKKFPFLTINMYYETEIPSLTRISLHVVLTRDFLIDGRRSLIWDVRLGD